MNNLNTSFNEDFIQFVWKFRLFDTLNLQTHLNQSIEIIQVGQQNFGSGPDFTNAKIKIGNTLWAGNVEIHHSNKDWYAHKHELDAAYNNVILHVVFGGNNNPITSQNNREVPTIVIGERIFEHTLAKYKLMTAGKTSFIPCEKIVDTSELFFFKQYYESLVFERLERKIADIENDLKFTKGSLDDAFLISLFKYFGAPSNKEPFEILARSFSLHQLIKQSTSVVQIEALLFGMAGMLNASDAYAQKLENEFEYLKNLYKLSSILTKSNWQFSNVRPPNFPTVRLAQLAALLFNEQRLLNFILEENDFDKIKAKFKMSVSEYWLTHYNFGKISPTKKKDTTDAFIDKLLINVVAPFLFFYGNYKNEEHFKEKAIDLLLAVAPESNSIVTNMSKLGFPTENAFDTQALIELKSIYCSAKKCLQCRIGYGILK